MISGDFSPVFIRILLYVAPLWRSYHLDNEYLLFISDRHSDIINSEDVLANDVTFLVFATIGFAPK